MMAVTMETFAWTSCPSDGEQVRVAVTIVHTGRLAVEDLNAEIERLAANPIYQEDFTGGLAAKFLNAAITTVGVHQGVTITCRVPVVRL